MQKQIVVQNQIVPYRVRVSRRARRLRLTVGCDSTVVVTIPAGAGENLAENFVKEKILWILRSLKYFQRFKNRPVIGGGRREYLKHKAQALGLIQSKLLQWNSYYGFAYSRVSIRNQRSRWGSCSRRGHLNFNYRVIYLPERLLDYLVVHELCHLQELNHSRKFWALVGRSLFDYKGLRRQLRGYVVADI
ncbi:MAG: M48 family metallopeptidase [Patescibacteria group bacterium]|nr:M48 family metallopeptidase [Patescibacteria group bacterium]